MQRYSDNLKLHETIWRPAHFETEISYPEDGNEVCFQVEDESFWFRHRNESILHCVDTYHDKSDFLFDVGGGNGYVASYMEKSGIKVCLVEPGPEGVIKAGERGLKNIVESTFEDCRFRSESLSSVGLFDVVEHVKDDVGFLTMVAEKVKPGGHVFLTVPAFDFLWSRNDSVAGHFRRYTLSSLQTVLTSAGFSVSYSSYLFSWLVVPIFLFRSIPSKLGVISGTNVRKNPETS
ncbi:MAG: class I SAM-dependent methyltransferase [Saprospiraceae bacterium]|nr:class I SAM-dependent methyltransferase [Saprospiraceae bacterium]